MKPSALPSVALAVALAVGSISCKTNDAGETVTDWNVVSIELGLGAADVRDAAELLSAEQTKADLLRLADYLDRAKTALDAADFDGTEDVYQLIASALDVADVLVDELDPDLQGDVRAGIIILRSALRRAIAYSGVSGAE